MVPRRRTTLTVRGLGRHEVRARVQDLLRAVGQLFSLLFGHLLWVAVAVTVDLLPLAYAMGRITHRLLGE